MKGTGWIDAHCHLADPRVFPNVGEILARSRVAGVNSWIQGGVDPEDWARQIDLHHRFGKDFVCVFGLHPWWVAAHTDEQMEKAFLELESLTHHARGWGELGLDFGAKFSDSDKRARQERALRKQLTLASRHPLPLVLHVVSAHERALEILRENGPYLKGGLVHSFSGDANSAREYLELGFCLSFSGSVLREKAQTLQTIVASLPSEKLIVETDSPDQAPAPIERGKNEPCHLERIAEGVAKLRGTTAHAVLEQSRENVIRIFGIGI